MHVFDRRTKLLQRERAAANKEVEKFDFLKEEVSSSKVLAENPAVPGRLQSGRQGAGCCPEDGGGG